MARQNEGVWYRASKDGWFITVEGKAVSLKVKGEKNKAEAIQAWHRLMSQEAPPKPVEAPPKAKAGATLKELVEAFLSDAKARVKANTYATYQGCLNPFAEAHGKAKAESITPAKALAYVNRDDWGQAHRRTILGAMKTAFKWAESEEVGLTTHNPLKAMQRPSMPSRGSKASVSLDTHERLLEASTPSFRLFLTILHETGCRPSEVSRLTAQYVDFPSGVVVLTEHKTSHATGKPRLIVLSPKALDILTAQAIAHPEGVLLRTPHGKEWVKNSSNYSMRKACKKAGVKAILYGYRHGYATDALSKGVPDATVASLLGHSGTTTLHRHYSHLTSRIAVLRDAVGIIRK